MFENYYPFNKVGFQSAHNKKYLVSLTTYNFKTEKNRYIVEVEKYNHNIYVVKYYLKMHKNNPRKFNLLSHEYRGTRIISTCIHIILSILKKDRFAHFGFLGAHTINFSKKFIEAKACTKRFRVYRTAIENLIGTEYFTHSMDEASSTYLIINNNVESVQQVEDAANRMFTELFPELA